jgi:hypothetical protein
MAEVADGGGENPVESKGVSARANLRALMRKLHLAILALLFASCGKLNEITDPGGGNGGVIPPDPNATFTRVQTQIFTPTCSQLGCHDRIARQESLILTADQAYSSIVGRASVQMPSLQRVQPNDPDSSYLYRKLTGIGITGDRMPQGLPPLSTADLALVRDWIRRGAPND